MKKLYSLEPPALPLPAEQAFARHARFRLRQDYLDKITRALATLDDEQIWWRPNPACNSIGNLLLHLAGNTRQWLIAGVGGQPDIRARAAEFAAQTGLDKAELLARLEDTVNEADEVLAKLAAHTDAEALLQAVIEPQGFPQTVLDAVFHVIEHFSYHTGQIVYLAKQLDGADLRLYDERALNKE